MREIVENQAMLNKITRNETLDICKGLLIILVVLRHALQYSVFDEGGILTNFIWAVQMPGFMLIAGYFSARNIDSLKQVKKRIAKVVRSYAVPFLSWFFIVDVFLLGKMNRNPISALALLITHIDSGLWFLWVIFILSLISTLCNFTKQSSCVLTSDFNSSDEFLDSLGGGTRLLDLQSYFFYFRSLLCF